MFILSKPGQTLVLMLLLAAAGQTPARAFKSADDSGLGPWAQCMSTATRNLPIGDSVKLNSLDPRCQPDTLYSWGPKIKLKGMLETASNPGEGANLAKAVKLTEIPRQTWKENFDYAVFSTVNPLPTFGYGDLLFRIKLKPGTKFAFFNHPPRQSKANYHSYCELIPASSWKDTVVVSYWYYGNTFTGLDYILCGTGPMESWSVGTKQGYSELTSSLQYTRTHKRWVSYMSTIGWKTPLYLQATKHPRFNPVYLSQNLKKMKALVDKEAGEIFYAPGVEKNPAGHFATKMPGYWNTTR